MCEVIKSNFPNLLPEILSNIENADFIAIDGEFTGLNANIGDSGSFFDTAEDRYQQLRRSASSFLLSQIGLSIFIAKKNSNEYDAFTYNFYLFPGTENLTDVIFKCQASSLEFLCQYNFDFNKFIYDGVPYINQSRLTKLKKQIKDKGLVNVGKFDVSTLQSCCTEVTEWAMKAQEHETMKLTLPLNLSPYILQIVLRQYMSDIWTTLNYDDQSILIEKVSQTARYQYENTHCSLEDEAIKSISGFSKIYEHLIKWKKPLIGHNLFLDLLMIYNHFQQPPPKSIKKFKREISKLFPEIFDTKHIIYEMRNELKNSKMLKVSGSKILEGQSLQDIYANFRSTPGKLAVLYQPAVTHPPDFDYYANFDCPHEAGYDSFLAGYVFLQLAHLYACKDLDPYEMRPFTFAELINALKGYTGKVNIIRGRVNYINLLGDDPICQRPEWLTVISHNRDNPMNVFEVTQDMARFGIIDYIVVNRYQVLVAVGNFRCAREILRSFQGHPEYRVTKYSVFRHSPVITPMLWTGMAITGGLGLWLMVTSCLKSRS